LNPPGGIPPGIPIYRPPQRGAPANTNSNVKRNADDDDDDEDTDNR
jgi:hypothetical protein